MKQKSLSRVSSLFVLNTSFLNTGNVDDVMLLNSRKREDQCETLAGHMKVYHRNYHRCFHMRNFSSCCTYILVAALFLHVPSSAITPDGNTTIAAGYLNGIDMFLMSNMLVSYLQSSSSGRDGILLAANQIFICPPSDFIRSSNDLPATL